MSEGVQCPVCESHDPINLFQVNGHRYVRCIKCKLIFLNRDINSEDAHVVYRTDAYQQLQTHHSLYFREAIFKRSLDEIEGVQNPGRVLDVGCGDGMFLNLAEKHGWETYGVEISPTAYEHAKTVLQGTVIRGDLRQGHFPDSFFDVVTVYNVLDHLHSPLDELLEIYRILKASGLLVLRVPNAQFHVNLLRILRFLESQLVFHLYCFTLKTIKHLLEVAGYGQIEIKNSMLTPFDPYSTSPMMGDIGMQVIKSAVYSIVQLLFYLSGGSLMVGPSLMIHAVKSQGKHCYGRSES
ncbi:MAG: class I SAM-dependent methyltransferase [Nitrospiria bacterium]